MGRNSEDRCVSMRFMVLIPVIIVLFPSSWIQSLSSWSYDGLPNSVKGFLGWSTSPAADLIVTNGVIWTGDQHLPWATSMAVSQGRVLRVGSVLDVQSTAGSQTRYVDLEGKFVSPGFIDSHVHFIPGGMKLSYLDLHNVRNRLEFVEKVHSVVKGLEEGVWIYGDSWDHHNWGGELPATSWIDDITPKNPVWMTRVDGHMGLANSYALALAGIDGRTADPKGGNIVRDDDGAPTGLLAEQAMGLLLGIIPESTIEDRREGLAKACKLALSQGITSVTDFGSYVPGASKESPWIDLHEVYLKSNLDLCARVSAFMPLETWPRVVELVKEKGRVLSDWIRIGGVKAFADGTLGSSTAFFHEPYVDEGNNRGGFVTDMDWMERAVIDADKAGLQVAIHVIGDAAVDRLISIVDVLNSTNGPRDRRFRLEHVQHLSPGGPTRVAASGIIASVQPVQLLGDAKYVTQKLGEERATQGSYAFSSMLGNGTRLVLGSDWNVVPLDALAGMKAAVYRTPDGWTGPWIGSETIPMEVALKGYTVDAAYASFMDEDVGSLTPGKFADFVVLSGDLLTTSSHAMPKVLATYVGGVLAYSTQGFPS
ncbi:unnamed protein product [Calypogeia fissa]